MNTQRKNLSKRSKKPNPPKTKNQGASQKPLRKFAKRIIFPNISAAPRAFAAKPWPQAELPRPRSYWDHRSWGIPPLRSWEKGLGKETGGPYFEKISEKERKMWNKPRPSGFSRLKNHQKTAQPEDARRIFFMKCVSNGLRSTLMSFLRAFRSFISKKDRPRGPAGRRSKHIPLLSKGIESGTFVIESCTFVVRESSNRIIVVNQTRCF